MQKLERESAAAIKIILQPQA